MKKSALLAAAVSGMMLGLGGVAVAKSTNSTGTNEVKAGIHAKKMMGDPPKADPKKEPGKHACKGKNECKGQGGCKTDKNECKGKNACKGQGGCATDGSKAPAPAPKK